MQKLRWVILLAIAYLLVPAVTRGQAANILKLYSPDKKTVFEIATRENGRIMYRVSYQNKQVMNWSAVGVTINDIHTGEHARISLKGRNTISETFPWPLGENDRVENKCNEFTVNCEASSINYLLRARAYNGSIAFRYEFPTKAIRPNQQVKAEHTSFHFTNPYTIYQYHHETIFTPVAIDTFNSRSDLPSTLTDGKLFITIGEAANDSYTKAELKRGALLHSLVLSFPRDSLLKMTGSFLTPWRTVSFAASAIGLHKHSELYLKLNPPPRDRPFVSGITLHIKMRARIIMIV